MHLRRPIDRIGGLGSGKSWAGTARAPPVSRLRVASFNVRNGWAFDWGRSWPFRRRALAATLEALDADVAGLQEAYAFQLRFLGRAVPGYRVGGEGRDGGQRGEHCPVLVRSAVARIVAARTRWYGEAPEAAGTRLPGARFPRIATTCRIELLAGGGHLDVTSTHLDERCDAHRRRSAAQLVGWLDPSVPNVVTGDFNAGPDSPVVAPLLEAGFRHALPPGPGGTVHRFTGRVDGRRIDHVLVRGPLEVVAAGVVTGADCVPARRASDHWPVVADLRLTGP
jgi:endonuclease/exonuclease/phosphatase family metal-dependent hydrolase